MTTPAKTVIFFIKAYQKTLSFETGFAKHFIPERERKVCMYYPSCSTYAILAIQKYGAGKGGIRAIKRITACRPGKEPKVDFP